MRSYSKLFYLFCCITFLSCGQEKKEPPPKEKWQEYYEIEEKLDSLNEKEAYNLTLKFNAISNNDSSLKFTYQLQEIVKENIKLISFIGNINDIIQKDNNFVLKIYGEFAQKRCFVEILVSPEIFQKIHSKLDPKESDKGCFIFKPTNIKVRSLLTIDADLSTHEYAETVEDANASAGAELSYDFEDDLLFFKGTLIDFYLYKKMPQNED